MIDVDAIYNDPSICDPAIVATWSGQSPLYAHILDAVFKEAATHPADKADAKEKMPAEMYQAVRKQHKRLAAESRAKDRDSASCQLNQFLARQRRECWRAFHPRKS